MAHVYQHSLLILNISQYIRYLLHQLYIQINLVRDIELHNWYLCKGLLDPNSISYFADYIRTWTDSYKNDIGKI